MTRVLAVVAVVLAVICVFLALEVRRLNAEVATLRQHTEIAVLLADREARATDACLVRLEWVRDQLGLRHPRAGSSSAVGGE